MADRGCFGLPSVFNPDSQACTSCVARTDCGLSSMRVLQLIRGTLNVESKIQTMRLEFAGIKASPVQTMTLDQSRAIASVPAKLQPRLKRLFEIKFDQVARQSFKLGENPFPPEGNKASRLAGELLLRGAFTKAEFRKESMRRFGWVYSTAATETSTALALLRGLGLAKFEGVRVSAT